MVCKNISFSHNSLFILLDSYLTLIYRKILIEKNFHQLKFRFLDYKEAKYMINCSLHF